jgi:hypothetical protein
MIKYLSCIMKILYKVSHNKIVNIHNNSLNIYIMKQCINNEIIISYSKRSDKLSMGTSKN